jgi:tape measure domain-containing protein
MSDYTLSAKITADSSGFEAGVQGAQSSLDALRAKCSETSSAASSEVGRAADATGSAWERAKDRASSALGRMGSGAGAALGAVRENATQLVGALGSIGQAGATAVAGIAVKGGFDRALAIDNAKKKLAGFGHDAADIQSIMDSATTAVRGTAYGLGDAATAAATLSAAGIRSGEDMTNSLQAVANAAAASGRGFNDVGVIFSSVAARGKLMGDDMLQLTSSGVPVLQLLADHLHKTTAEVSDMVSSGQIDFKTFSDAMREGLGDAAKSSGDTLEGAVANVGSALSRMTEPLATPVIQGVVGLMKQLGPAIDGVSSALGPVMPALAPVVAGLAAFAASGLAPVLAGLPMVGPLLGPVTSLLSALGGPVGIAAAALVGLTAVCPPLQEAFGSLLGSLGELGRAVIDVVGPAAKAALDALQPLVQVLGQGLAAAIGAAAGVISELARGLSGMAEGGGSALDGLRPVAEWVQSTLGPVVESARGALSVVSQTLGEVAASAQATLGPSLQTLAGLVASVAQALAGVLGPALQLVASLALNALGAAFQVAGALVSGAMQVVAGAVTTAVGVIETVLGVLVGVFTGDWSMAAEGARTAMGGMQEAVLGILNGLSGAVVGVLNGIVGHFGAILGGVPGIAEGALSALSSLVGGRMDGLRDAVAGGLDAVAGLFRDLHIEWPHIPLPHFSVSGELNLDPAHFSVPSIGIDWYARGALLTRPTLFGVAGGRAMGGGEAGPEAVAPVDRLVGFIVEALGQLGVGGGQDGVTVNVSSLVVREEADVERIADRLNTLIGRSRRAGGTTWATQ